jgi:hypothetical protein
MERRGFLGGLLGAGAALALRPVGYLAGLSGMPVVKTWSYCVTDGGVLHQWNGVAWVPIDRNKKWWHVAETDHVTYINSVSVW